MPRTYVPAEVFHPGEFLSEEAAALDIDMRMVAIALELSAQEVIDLYAGKIDIDDRLAESIAALVGGSSRLWLNLQTAWDQNPHSRSPRPLEEAVNDDSQPR